MPAFKRFNRRLMLPGRSRYTLFDSFSVDAAAGAVDGTYSDKSHSLRTVADTENLLSISGGKIVFAGGKAAPAWGDPGLWYPAEARVAGKVLLLDINISAGQVVMAGWQTAQNGYPQEAGAYFTYASSLDIYTPTGNFEGFAWAGNTAYKLAMVLRNPGLYVFIKGGTYTYWTLLAHHTSGSATPLYPCISDNAAALTADEPRVARRLWLPEPLAYDAFTRADGPLTVSDSVGPDGQACQSRTWSFPAGTWAISGNAAVISPTAGAELVTNGNMETGDPPTGYWVADAALTTGTAYAGLQGGLLTATANAFAIMGQDIVVATGQWVTASAWAKKGTTAGVGMLLISGAWGTLTTCADISSVGFSQTFGTARSTDGEVKVYLQGKSTAIGQACTIDDISLKPLTLASLFSSVSDAKTADVKVRVKCKVLVSGTQMGAVARLDSTTAPTTGIIAYFDGAGSIVVDEFTAAATWNNLIPAVAKAFTAEDIIELDVCGDAVRVYHITDAGVATLIGSATATANTNVNHGAFSTYVGNSLTSVLVEPKGTNDNAWRALDSL